VDVAEQLVAEGHQAPQRVPDPASPDRGRDAARDARG
jgi:hypothetical protein